MNLLPVPTSSPEAHSHPHCHLVALIVFRVVRVFRGNAGVSPAHQPIKPVLIVNSSLQQEIQ
jgi:hypothetical protein